MSRLHSAAHMARHAPLFERTHRKRLFAKWSIRVYLSLLTVFTILEGFLHAY